MFRPAPIALAVALIASGAHADTLTGRASVIDGDIIEIHGERIRILDIDAPESGQLCFKKSESIDEGAWPCGQQAALALAEWIGEQTVSCDAASKDKHRRWLARCAVAGQDMGEWLAASGWVVPYRDCTCEVVRQAADRAKAAQLGIWSSNFTMPWEWRKAH
jgi:endonuclease YncB( thermonuclease family)